ncbi:uncharacterized protein LOC128982839 [Macrosteles quadrilineatus]|uniref:uncharacterized protein LOC128982839 n=1 Tax=Macrosteles quadrilineatus TaxID=74068 RepID=UPI0023E1A05F|nr:uncharacterized protein LOC128982839 [Macrosteles quadrilineatus]
MPSTSLPECIKDGYKHLELADPTFDVPGKIEFLLGADLYPEVIDGGRMPAPKGYPVPYQSSFGYILMGPIDLNSKTQPYDQVSSIVSNDATIEHSLDDQLRSFCELEEIPVYASVNLEEEKCEKIYCNAVKRNQEGRYIVPLPFKIEDPKIGESYGNKKSSIKAMKIMNNYEVHPKNGVAQTIMYQKMSSHYRRIYNPKPRIDTGTTFYQRPKLHNTSKHHTWNKKESEYFYRSRASHQFPRAQANAVAT